MVIEIGTQILEARAEIESWLQLNSGFVERVEITETEYEFSVTAMPKAEGASAIVLKLSKGTFEVDIGAGLHFSLSDYKYEGKEEIIAILEAIKAGQIEERICTFLGVEVEVSGKISASTGSIYSKSVGLLGMGLLLPKREHCVRFRPWSQ